MIFNCCVYQISVITCGCLSVFQQLLKLNGIEHHEFTTSVFLQAAQEKKSAEEEEARRVEEARLREEQQLREEQEQELRRAEEARRLEEEKRKEEEMRLEALRSVLVFTSLNVY